MWRSLHGAWVLLVCERAGAPWAARPRDLRRGWREACTARDMASCWIAQRQRLGPRGSAIGAGLERGACTGLVATSPRGARCGGSSAALGLASACDASPPTLLRHLPALPPARPRHLPACPASPPALAHGLRGLTARWTSTPVLLCPLLDRTNGSTASGNIGSACPSGSDQPSPSARNGPASPSPRIPPDSPRRSAAAFPRARGGA